MPNVAVQDLKFHGSKLVAFTHGRGAFELATDDLDGNNMVECADVNLIRSAFNTRVGQASFNPVADLNPDGAIDARDLRMISMQSTSAFGASTL